MLVDPRNGYAYFGNAWSTSFGDNDLVTRHDVVPRFCRALISQSLNLAALGVAVPAAKPLCNGGLPIRRLFRFASTSVRFNVDAQPCRQSTSSVAVGRIATQFSIVTKFHFRRRSVEGNITDVKETAGKMVFE